jgi:hypothetical protein
VIHSKCRESRVARWFAFRPKIPIRANFGGPKNVSIFYGHLEYFMEVWDIL